MITSRRAALQRTRFLESVERTAASKLFDRFRDTPAAQVGHAVRDGITQLGLHDASASPYLAKGTQKHAVMTAVCAGSHK